MSEQVSTERIDALLNQVRGVYSAREFQRAKLHKLLKWVIICLVIMFVSALGAIYYLSLLKEKKVEAGLVILDAKNGIIQQVQYMEPESKIMNNEAVIRSFSYDYIVNRYGYYWVGSTDTLRMRYAKVLAFTSQTLKASVANEISSRNPESPYNTFGEKGAVEIDNVTMNLYSGNRIQINFRSTVKDGSGANKVYSYTALGTYAWNQKEGLSVDDLAVNPLGFAFTEWSITQNASNDALNPTAKTVTNEQTAGQAPATVAPNQTITPSTDSIATPVAPVAPVNPLDKGQK